MYKSFFYLLTIVSLLSVSQTLAQAPNISSIDKIKGTIDEEVIISGGGFSSNASDLDVFFGGAKGEITFASTNLLEVKVPAGAIFDNITVINKQTGLIGYSKRQFLLSFGSTRFNTAFINNEVNFPGETGLYDLCSCDFDGDGKLDMAAANNNANFLTLYRNTSTVANVSFVRSNININTPSISIICGDLDGDGKPDLVATRSGAQGDRLFVFKNTSTPGNISFSAPINLVVAGLVNLRNVEIRDLDLNGKPELIVTNEEAGNLFIFENISTAGTLNFRSTPITLNIAGANNSTGLAVRDLNGDGFPEIVLNTFFGPNLYFFTNQSSPGTIRFSGSSTITIPGELVNVRIGDMDRDGRPDLMATQLTRNEVVMLLNTTASSTSSISFGAPRSFPVTANPWSMALGDVDGNGLIDLAVSSISQTARQFTVLRNTSTPGNLSFERINMPINENTRGMLLADFNNDGKPDFAYTSITSFQTTVRLNRNCIEPEITPSGTITICEGLPFRLNATKGVDVLYKWFRDGVEVKSSNEAFIDIEIEGTYTAQAISNNGACQFQSQNVIQIIKEGQIPAQPTLNYNGPICEGETLILTATNVSGAQYVWAGPNEFRDTTNVNTYQIPNFSGEIAGRYTVEIILNDCQSPQVVLFAESINLPTVTIRADESLSLCGGNEAGLSVPNFAGLTYQWQRNGTNIAGATGTNFSATLPGTYTVSVGSATGCTVITDPVTINEQELPEALFTLPSSICIGERITLINNTVVPSGIDVDYRWEFGDGNISTQANPTTLYERAGTFTVKLKVSIRGAASCFTETTQTITVNSPGEFEILLPEGNSFCAGSSLTLEIPEGFNNPQWSTNANTRSISVSTAGTYSVTATDANGCRVEASAEIIQFPVAQVQAFATPEKILQGDSTLLSASGALSYVWSPGNLVRDSIAAETYARPNITTLFKVKMIDSNGCEVEREILVEVEPVGGIATSKVFTPNGDGINDLWIIDNLDNFSECTTVIVTIQGTTVYEKTPYQNDWDGNFQGKPLPEGVYYYLISCPNDEEKNVSGSITLLR